MKNMASVLERFLIAEITRIEREMRRLEDEIRFYQRILRKIRKGVSTKLGT